ncbi:aldo/keto reductase [Limnoglobus roseus]|uniref:Aldo/keto reductase n=1 Tax=Limnoglobus roseus TaxID=2598579 RepID=A0A5C1A6S9_9BACT|nr:aldo/keto reductase [Limnoglobus roseus]QEL14891.1 aldo/keto reductase [Limnoglobus roseus]
MSLPTRPLGKTGVDVSLICLGGWHIGQPAIGDAEAIRIMHAAIDEGVTFFDNAWDYHEGHSEDLMGRALADGNRRQKVFLMTKNCGRDAATSRQHLEDSLRRLRTDVIDLWQFHEINYDNDPEWIVERGALADAIKAQKEGKVRFIGYTGHKSPHILAKMLPLHAWDTCQLPINVCDHFYRSFRHELLPDLLTRGIAPIGMKSLGGGNFEAGGQIVANGVVTAEEAIRYSLSQPISSLVVGVDSMKVLQQDVTIARDFKPLEGDELAAVLAKAKPAAGDGRHEWHKSTQNFDGPYHRQQHGFAV